MITRPLSADRRERGAVAALVSISLFLLLGSAAFAVDLGMWMWQSNRLQAASDLAALAGAQIRGEGGNQFAVENAVREVLVVNGADPAQSNRTLSVSLVNRSDVRVDLVQRSNPMFFSKLLVNNVTLSRTAQASTGICLSRCSRTIEMDPPPNLTLRSNGDGYTPVILGDRIYTMNHHAYNAFAHPWGFPDPLVCYELSTGTPCAGYPRLGTITTSMLQRVRAYEPRSELWFTYADYDNASGQLDWFLGCWSTTGDRWCGQWRVLDDYTNQADQDGTSQPVKVGTRLYLFGMDNRVFCYDMATPGPCAGYPRTDGNLLLYGSSTSTYGPDTLTVGTKIYRTHMNLFATYVACWDTATNGSCSGVWPVSIGGTSSTWGATNLIPSLDANAIVNGACFYGNGPVTCARLTGWTTFSRADIDAALPARGNRSYGSGILVGRKWIFGGYTLNATHCLDLVSATSCGQRNGDLPYDFMRLPNSACVIGLGHAGVAFSVDVDDVSQECRPTKGSMILYPCACADGTVYWANLEISDSLLAPFVSFVMSVKDNLGNEIIPPTDVKANGGVIDLRSVPTTVPFIEVTYDGTLPVGFVWTQTIRGELVVNNRPTLRQ